MADPDDSNQDRVDSGVRRTVGVAALRQLRVLVDAERAQDDTNTRAVPVIVVVIAVIAVVFVLLLPPTQGLLKSLLP